MNAKEQVESAIAWGRQIQREQPDYWDSIPDGPMPPKGLKAQVCWILKQYDKSDPETRDLPYHLCPCCTPAEWQAFQAKAPAVNAD